MNTDEETNFDPFEEEAVTTEEDVSTETEVEEESPEDEESTPEDESTDEPEEEEPKEKVIPESRFKAAIKNLQDQLDGALQENANLKAQSNPPPNRDEDPEGHEAHIRLEMSKSLMMEFKEDYVEVIKHYQEMAKTNPQLNEMVAKAELPAKLAYDLAKRDMEIREVVEARNSDEWKEFQEFKKNKGKKDVANELAKTSNTALNLPKNTNRATESIPKNVSPDEEEYLFGDAAF